MKTVVIVMPAWNEVGNIKEMIDILVKEEFPKIQANMQLLIIDNHSKDGMTEIVEKLGNKYKNVHIIQQTGKGLGWAYVTGMKYAMKNLHADAILEMDADFQHPPRFIKPMVMSYLDGADYVIGSRYIKGGSVPKEWAMSRKLISSFGNLFIRLSLFNFRIHDLTTGFRLTKVKGVLDKIDLENLMELNRFAYKVDLLYQSLKISKKTVEVPLAFASRTKEKSKFNYKEMISTFKVAMILGIQDKQKFIKFGIVGGTGFIVNFIALRAFRTAKFPETISWILSTELAIVSNFTWNNLWTFRNEKIQGVNKLILKFLQFNLGSVGAIIIQSIAGPIGVGIVGAKYDFLVLGIVVAFLVLPYNYFIYNRFIWKTS
jgi:dolichol-phosphate mannosyltransferase